jgi:hypothetical protein
MEGRNQVKDLMIMLTAIAMAVWGTGCSRSDTEQAVKTGGQGGSAAFQTRRGPQGQTSVSLDAKTREVMGLEVAELAPKEVFPEMKCLGRVLDPAAFVPTAMDLAAARATADATRKELVRVRLLAGQNNASPRVLEAAEVAAQRDAAALESARARLAALTGVAIAERDDLVPFMRTLASGEGALVRVALPAGENAPAGPSSLRVIATDGGGTIEAQYVEMQQAVDPVTQGRAFLFLAVTNRSRLAAGAAVTAYLKTADAPLNGVGVPASAVVRHDGAAWVYLQASDDVFGRVPVALDHPIPGGWLVLNGLHAGARVVTVGAQELLSEELREELHGLGGGE